MATEDQKFTLIVDERRYVVDVAELCGYDVRALCGIPDSWALFIEQRDTHTADVPLGDRQPLRLDVTPPPQIFSRPPTLQGAA